VVVVEEEMELRERVMAIAAVVMLLMMLTGVAVVTLALQPVLLLRMRGWSHLRGEVVEEER
jgi:hypothetical protein